MNAPQLSPSGGASSLGGSALSQGNQGSLENPFITLFKETFDEKAKKSPGSEHRFAFDKITQEVIKTDNLKDLKELNSKVDQLQTVVFPNANRIPRDFSSLKETLKSEISQRLEILEKIENANKEEEKIAKTERRLQEEADAAMARDLQGGEVSGIRRDLGGQEGFDDEEIAAAKAESFAIAESLKAAEKRAAEPSSPSLATTKAPPAPVALPKNRRQTDAANAAGDAARRRAGDPTVKPKNIFDRISSFFSTGFRRIANAFDAFFARFRS